MDKSVLNVKFKNNKKKELVVLFAVLQNHKNYIVYKLNDNNEDEIEVSCVRLDKNNKLCNLNNNEQLMIEQIIENFTKAENEKWKKKRGKKY